MAYAALSQFCMRQQVAGIAFSFLYYPCVLGKGLNEAGVWQLNSNTCREAHHTRDLGKLKVVWLSSEHRGQASLVQGTMEELHCCAVPEPLSF